MQVQIDVTLSVPTSAGLAMAACALAGAGGASRTDTSAKGTSVVGGTAAVFLVLIAAWVGVKGAGPAWKWEKLLESAAADARVVAEFSERWQALQSGGASVLFPRDDVGKFVADLSKEIGPTTMQGLEGSQFRLERKRLGAAAEKLNNAMKLRPGEWRVGREQSRLHLRLASGYLQEKDRARADAEALRARCDDTAERCEDFRRVATGGGDGA